MLCDQISNEIFMKFPSNCLCFRNKFSINSNVNLFITFSEDEVAEFCDRKEYYQTWNKQWFKFKPLDGPPDIKKIKL